MRIERACHGAVQCHTMHAMDHEGIAHGGRGGGTRLDDICCTMVYSNHGHRFACSVMLELGSRAPIAIKWPAAVLVIWPHFNGNAQRRPRGASSGLALFPSGYVAFYAQAMGIQEENQIGRGAAEKSEVRSRAFWSAPMGVCLVYWPVYM